jgi:hypothetical protein
MPELFHDLPGGAIACMSGESYCQLRKYATQLWASRLTIFQAIIQMWCNCNVQIHFHCLCQAPLQSKPEAVDCQFIHARTAISPADFVAVVINHAIKICIHPVHRNHDFEEEQICVEECIKIGLRCSSACDKRALQEGSTQALHTHTLARAPTVILASTLTVNDLGTKFLCPAFKQHVHDGIR